MAEIMKVQCYKCQTVYDIPEDMAGQLVECAVCSVTFAVPAPIPGREDQILATFPYVNFNETAVDVRADSEQDAQNTPPSGTPAAHDTEDTSVNNYQDTSTKTKTVKLSRSNFGMIPKIEGEDGIGTVEKKHHAASAVARKKQDEFVSSGQTVPAKPAPAKPPSTRKWWQFWR
jgi:hypothetical protein